MLIFLKKIQNQICKLKTLIISKNRMINKFRIIKTFSCGGQNIMHRVKILSIKIQNLNYINYKILRLFKIKLWVSVYNSMLKIGIQILKIRKKMNYYPIRNKTS